MLIPSRAGAPERCTVIINNQVAIVLYYEVGIRVTCRSGGPDKLVVAKLVPEIKRQVAISQEHATIRTKVKIGRRHPKRIVGIPDHKHPLVNPGNETAVEGANELIP